MFVLFKQVKFNKDFIFICMNQKCFKLVASFRVSDTKRASIFVIININNLLQAISTAQTQKNPWRECKIGMCNLIFRRHIVSINSTWPTSVCVVFYILLILAFNYDNGKELCAMEKGFFVHIRIIWVGCEKCVGVWIFVWSWHSSYLPKLFQIVCTHSAAK